MSLNRKEDLKDRVWQELLTICGFLITVYGYKSLNSSSVFSIQIRDGPSITWIIMINIFIYDDEIIKYVRTNLKRFINCINSLNNQNNLVFLSSS